MFLLNNELCTALCEVDIDEVVETGGAAEEVDAGVFDRPIALASLLVAPTRAVFLGLYPFVGVCLP